MTPHSPPFFPTREPYFYTRLISAFGGYLSSALDEPFGLDLHMSVWPLRKTWGSLEELELLHTVLYASQNNDHPFGKSIMTEQKWSCGVDWGGANRKGSQLTAKGVLPKENQKFCGLHTAHARGRCNNSPGPGNYTLLRTGLVRGVFF